MDALDDERDVVACRRADQPFDQSVGDILDGFVAEGECRIGEAKQTVVETLVASFDEAIGVQDEQIVRAHVESRFWAGRFVHGERGRQGRSSQTTWSSCTSSGGGWPGFE